MNRYVVVAVVAAALPAGADLVARRPVAATPSNGPRAAASVRRASQPASSRVQPLPASAHLFTSAISGLGEPETRVVRTRAAWERTWGELQRGLAAGGAPAVDFTHEMVVVVAAGSKPTGGHALRVDATQPSPDGGLVVHATRASPGAGCMSAQVETAPVDVVRVPRARGPVTLALRDVRAPC